MQDNITGSSSPAQGDPILTNQVCRFRDEGVQFRLTKDLVAKKLDRTLELIQQLKNECDLLKEELRELGP